MELIKIWFVFSQLSTELLADAGQAPAEATTVSGSKYKQILGIKAVHFMAIFAIVYIGVEVTVGGTYSSGTLVMQSSYARTHQHTTLNQDGLSRLLSRKGMVDIPPGIYLLVSLVVSALYYSGSFLRYYLT